MKIDHLILGSYQTNCYILRCDSSAADCLIIDTGLEAGPLLDFLQSNKLNPVAVVLTHGHADHITAIPLLRQAWPDIKVYIHKLDATLLADCAGNLSALAGISFKTEPADVILNAGDTIEAAGIRLGVFHTPGHTQGGICLYSKDDGIVFTGDTLFAESVGRTDFPGGDMAQLIESIKQNLCSLADETVVYPGHGPETTIAQEKKYNPYLKNLL